MDFSNAVYTLITIFAHTGAEPNTFNRETPPVGLISLIPGFRQEAINHIFALG